MSLLINSGGVITLPGVTPTIDTIPGLRAALEAAAVGGKTAYTISPVRPIALFGDSRAYFNWNVDDGVITPSLGARSHAYWAQTLSHGRVQASYRFNFGKKGWSTWDNYNLLLTNSPNLAGVSPNDPGYSIAVILIGTNDISNAADFGTMKTQLQYVIDKLKSYNKKVVIIAEWPRGGLTAVGQKAMQRWVAYLKAMRSDNTLTIIDVWPRAADPASLTSAAITNMLATDDLHNSPGIGYLTGSLLAKELAQLMPPANYGIANNGDVYDATAHPGGCLNSNPMLRGTGGTLGAGATGIVPDGYTLSATSGLSVVGSSVTLADGRTAYRLAVSGTTTANHAAAILRFDGLQAKVAPGDNIRAGYEVQVAAAHKNFAAPTVKLDTGAAATDVYGGVSLNIDRTMPAQIVEAFNGTSLSPEYTVPATVPTSLAVEFRPMFTSTGLVSALTIDLVSAFVKKTVVEGAAISGVSVDPSSFSLAIGDSITVVPTVAPAGSSQAVTYTYDNTLFGITGNTITRIAGADGATPKITVNTPNGKTASITVTLTATAGSPAAITQQFSRLVIAGSTDEANAFYERTQGEAMTRRLRTKYGIAKADGSPLTMLLNAYAGDYQSGFESRYLASLQSGLSATDMLYFGATLMRDASNAYTSKNNGAVSNAWTGSAGDLDLKAAHKRIMLALAATGATVFPQTLKFANYGSRAQDAEAAGTKGFNDNAIVPNIKEMTPRMHVGQTPYFDVYPMTASLYPTGYGDNETLTMLAQAPYRNFIMDNLNARIKGLAPISVTQLFNKPMSPQPCRVFGINGGSFNPMSPLMYNSAMYQYTMGVAQYLPALEGYTLNSINVTTYSNNQADNGAANSATGNTNDSLQNDAVKRYAFNVESGQGIKQLVDIMGLNPNQSFEFRFVSAYYNTALVTTKVIELSSDNFATVKGENSGSILVGAEPVIKTLTFTADANGKCSIYIRAKAGSTAGYINGYEIWPL